VGSDGSRAGPAVTVQKKELQSVRTALLERGWLDQTRKPGSGVGVGLQACS
jgi:hypothetical protein